MPRDQASDTRGLGAFLTSRAFPVLLLGALIPIAGCSGAAVNGPETPEQHLAGLYQAAKAEGEVTLYSSMGAADAQQILPGFEARYPGVKINYIRAADESLIQRIVNEKAAGQDLFDVVETNILSVKFLIDQGYTQPYRPITWEDFPQDHKDHNGAWIADRLNNYLPAINTSKVAAGTISRWQDLCDKQYEGHIAVEKNDVAVYTALKKILGEPEAQRTLQCIAANKPTLRSGHTDMANRLAAGEFWVTFSSNGHRLAQLKYREHAPVDWVHTDPVITDITLIALSNRPPHPKAARLLIEWLTSLQGQQAIADTGRVPASSKVKLMYPDLESPGPIFLISPSLEADYNADSAFWRSTFGIP